MENMWALSDVLKYFQEDPEEKETLTDREFRSIINPDKDFLTLLKTALEYQGFDPRIIMRQLVRNRKSYMAQKRSKLEWGPQKCK